jgi:hypothetical protein
VSDPSDYARQIETYLCRKNGGHLVRVVGPAFEMVSGWAASGVPLKVAFLGIDRCCARREAKGGGRRPLRIEFCEADVLDAFDAWRRAVGVARAADSGVEEPAPRKPALAAHIERVIARLAYIRGTGPAATPLQQRLDALVRELEPLAASAVRARGDARAAIVARLAELDASMLHDVIGDTPREDAERLRAEAREELAPFGARMPAHAHERAVESAFVRLVREAAGLPILTYE